MSRRVSASIIEQIVGVQRHRTRHYGRASSADEIVHILHSQECKDSGIDLRDCPFSVALDRGIDKGTAWEAWKPLQDRPVAVVVSRDGWLMPATDEEATR